MTDKSTASFAVVRFNERTYQSGGVMAVIKGTEAAERTLNDFDWCQGDDNRRAGWRYFLEATDLPPGMDPGRPPHFDKCGSIFKRFKLIGANDFMQLTNPRAVHGLAS